MSTASAGRRRATRRLRRLPSSALDGVGGGAASVLVAATGTVALGLAVAVLVVALRTERDWQQATAGTTIVIPDPQGPAADGTGARIDAVRALVGHDAATGGRPDTAALLSPWLGGSDRDASRSAPDVGAAGAPATASTDPTGDPGSDTVLPTVLALKDEAPPTLAGALARVAPGAWIDEGGGSAGARLRSLGHGLVLGAGAAAAMLLGAIAALLALLLGRAAGGRVARARVLLEQFGIDAAALRHAAARRAALAGTLGVLLGVVPLAAALGAAPLAWLGTPFGPMFFHPVPSGPIGFETAFAARSLPWLPALLLPCVFWAVGFRVGRDPGPSRSGGR